MQRQEKNSAEDTGTAYIRRVFTISGDYFGGKCFPGMNDLLHEQGRHPKSYAAMKRQYEMVAINAIRRQLKGYKARGRIRLHYEFGEPKDGHLRDYDNVESGAKKFVNDSLKKAGVIKDDGPYYLAPCTVNFVYTSGKPYIRVEIEEVEPFSFGNTQARA